MVATILDHDLPRSANDVGNIAIPTEQERASLAQKTLREREWYGQHERFATPDDIIVASRLGKLVFVAANSDIIPAKRFRNPELTKAFPPFLLPNSLLAYRTVGKLWRRQLEKDGVADEGLRLASTSFVRSVEEQEEKAKNPRKLAEKDSTHTAGAAFDTDDASGYWVSPSGELHRLVHPDLDHQTVGNIAKELGRDPMPPIAPIDYDPRIFEVAYKVADTLHQQGIVNSILEFEGTPNQCLHWAPNPEVGADDWLAIAA